MRHSPTFSASTSPRVCIVCGDPIYALRAATIGAKAGDAEATCQDTVCQGLYARGRSMTAEAFQSFVRHHGRPLVAKKIRARRTQARIDAQALEDADCFSRIADHPRAKGAAPSLALVVATGAGPSRSPSKTRRRRYAAHLDAIIAEAFASPSPTREATAEPLTTSTASQLPGRLCGACGGGCCHLGGDRAFLTADTMRRVRADHPDLDPAGLRALYLDRLPARSIARSCINHRSDGCSLPRALRADICNRFACDALSALETNLASDRPAERVMVIRRRQNHWNRTDPDLNTDITGWTLLTETATARFRPPRPKR